MLNASIASLARAAAKLGAAARRFIGADQGNIAVIFAVALVPLISFIGAAIDYSRANAARSSMQAALDSTALMLSKDLTQGLITPDQINTKAQLYFNALYNNKDAKSVTINATYTPQTSMGSTIQVTGSGSVMTDFMQVAGFPHLDFNTGATSAWGNVRMRVAMALDNTGSMADDGKMPTMQEAAGKLIDQLSALNKHDGDIYISIIPFAKDVNAGPTNYTKDWIDWSAWDAANGTCSNTGNQSNKTTKSSCENAGRTWTHANHNTWNGCVWDRDKDTVPQSLTSPSGYDSTNAAPVAGNTPTLFQAEQWASCPVPLMALSNKWQELKDVITSMTPAGNTNQAIGMAWAWQSLAQTPPLNAPAKDLTNYTYKDAIILLSDGLNTQDRWYTDAASIDARQRKLCDNARSANITVYTIQVNTNTSHPDPTSAVLQYCATVPGNAYIVTDPHQTVSVFTEIGNSLSRLRVAR